MTAEIKEEPDEQESAKPGKGEEEKKAVENNSDVDQ